MGLDREVGHERLLEWMWSQQYSDCIFSQAVSLRRPYYTGTVTAGTPDSTAVDWAALDWAGFSEMLDPPAAEGLRERKKRLTRQHLSDTATAMFLDRGFDAVRVAEVAEACQVSEKTVYNYFPTKESLILDREDAMAAALRAALGDTSVAPVAAMLSMLIREITAVTTWLKARDDGRLALPTFQRFRELIETTPALRAHQADTMDRLADVAAQTLSHRAGLRPDDPEARMAAHALLGLWRVQYDSLGGFDGTQTTTQLQRHVVAYITRAAQVLESGLSRFDAPATGG
jgi:AcrR family transcriptional regulator